MKRLFHGLLWTGRQFAGRLFGPRAVSPPGEPGAAEVVRLSARYSPLASLTATDSSLASLTATDSSLATLTARSQTT